MRARTIVRIVLAAMTVVVLWNLSVAATTRRPPVRTTSAGCGMP
jgi:hypothetical protein